MVKYRRIFIGTWDDCVKVARYRLDLLGPKRVDSDLLTTYHAWYAVNGPNAYAKIERVGLQAYAVWIRRDMPEPNWCGPECDICTNRRFEVWI